MKISLCVGATLLTLSTAAYSQRPPIYPLRGQSPAAQGIDNALCYAQAKAQTGVDMARQSQRPPRTTKARFGPDAGHGASEPPLPARRAAAGGAGADTGVGAADSADKANAAAGSAPIAGNGAPSAPSHPTASPSSAAASSAAVSASPASGPAGQASAPAVASANLPPLPPPPPPEPPMVTYWNAYSDCMQARGYGGVQ